MAWDRWFAALAGPECDLHLGRVTLPRDELGPRVMDLHVLFLVLDGEYRVFDQHGQVAHAHPGDLLWLPARQQHAVRSLGLVRKYFMRLRLAADQPPGEPWCRRLGDEAVSWCGALLAEQGQEDSDHQRRQQALLTLLFSAWRRAGASQPGGLDPERKARLLTLLAEDPARRWSGAELAAALGVSALHLSRQVRRSFGQPLRSWLVDVRIRAAARALRDGSEPVGAVAGRHGYDDLFLFSRQFSRVMGVSPRRFRAN